MASGKCLNPSVHTHQLLAVLVPQALGDVQWRLPRLVSYKAGRQEQAEMRTIKGTEQRPKLNRTRPMKSAACARQPGPNSSYDCMELVAEILQGLHGSRPSSHRSSQLTESNMQTLHPMKRFPTVRQPEPCGWRQQPV